MAALRVAAPELRRGRFGTAVILGMICLLGGFQLLSVGLLGEYIGRVYEQVKDRPAYLVRWPRRATPFAQQGAGLSGERLSDAA